MRKPLAAATALVAIAVAAAPASAKTLTMRYYSVASKVKFLTASGQPADPNRPPAAGYVLDITDRDYVGNHTHHAKQWTATDHLRCVFQSATSDTCDGQVAIGGSMLLANGVHPNLNANPAKYAINGGTGAFLGAHGVLSVAVVPHSNGTDFTIRVKV